MPTGDGGAVINPFADANSETTAGLNNFIQNSFDSLDTSLPQGYLVTMFFDNDLNLVPEYSGVQRVTEAGSLQKLAVLNQKMPSDGFYYTYVTNQSAQLIQYDNLTYIHIEGVLKEATDYYPYGLLCSSATIGTVGNYKFQDKEFNKKEFANTWGLDWYNHGARMYDPELGRWHVQDPALQFANPYLAMGNNPINAIDPDGEFILLAASLIFTELGFDIQKFTSPIALHIDLNLGKSKTGIGIDLSVGIPQEFGLGARAEGGISYNFKNGNITPGWETRHGMEYTVGLVTFGTTNYNSPGTKFDQKVGHATIGVPGCNVKYANDFFWDIPVSDGGDRYRTGALKLQIGGLSVGFNIFTGDPGLDRQDRKTTSGLSNKFTEYKKNSSGNDPDEYRAGIGYVGIGSYRFGTDTEKRRDYIQNGIHNRTNTPHFKYIDRSNKWYLQYWGGGGLW